jgi:hypothetical protein
MPKIKHPNGAVIYEGPSMIDGQHIIAIAVGLANASSNRKTGNMIQTYILRADQSPIDAVNSGADVSICGDCKLRGIVENGKNKRRRCYVNLGQGPLSVWLAWTRGNYPIWDGFDVSGRLVRLGTYGDPMAVPHIVWRSFLKHASGWTGYTHQWKRPSAGFYARYCMASVDSEDEAREAIALGWRTFRVAMPGHIERLRFEAVCPASAEAGKKLTCETCRACDGTASGTRGSIVIQAHGSSAVMANVRRVAA